MNMKRVEETNSVTIRIWFVRKHVVSTHENFWFIDLKLIMNRAVTCTKLFNFIELSIQTVVHP